MSGIGYYYDENGVKQEMEIGPSFDKSYTNMPCMQKSRF